MSYSGYKHTEETKRRMSEAHKGQKVSKEQRQKSSETMKRITPTGAAHHSWKGGRHQNSHGYILLSQRSHPRASKDGLISEHTVVMEKHLGRYLTPDENVHHKNGIRDDNRIENLELWIVTQPSGQRLDDLIDFVAKNYAEEVRLRIKHYTSSASPLA